MQRHRNSIVAAPPPSPLPPLPTPHDTDLFDRQGDSPMLVLSSKLLATTATAAQYNQQQARARAVPTAAAMAAPGDQAQAHARVVNDPCEDVLKTRSVRTLSVFLV